MNQQQFNFLQNGVLYALRCGNCEQALGMLQGACAVTDLHVTYASGLDIDQLFKWVDLAGIAAIDRKFDDMQRQEWHDTQSSLEASVRL